MKAIFATVSCLCFFFFSSTYAFAVSKPYNTNVLIAKGIDPHILNMAVTTYRQKVAFTIATQHTVTTGDNETSLTYDVLFNPYASYGIDLRVKVPVSELDKLEDKDISNYLDELMGLQSYLQQERLYDQNSLKVESETAEQTVVSFRFAEGALPRELNYLYHMKGFVYVTNKGLDKVVLRNQQRYEYHDVEVTQYEKTLKFAKVPLNGGYLLEHINIKQKGIVDGVAQFSEVDGEVVAYSDKQDNHIALRGGAQKQITKKDEEYKTFFVELDRTFPLLGQAARKQGYDLPKPFGVSMVTMLQSTTLHMTSFELDGEDVSGIIGGKDAKVDSTAGAMLVRADMWLLPFLNVGVILGTTESSNDISLQWFPEGGLGGIIKPGEKFTLEDSQAESLVYGGGATVAGGIGDFFATIDFQYITAYTKVADAELSMFILTPMVGYNFTDYGARVLIGAQYQDQKEQIVAKLTNDAGEVRTAIVGLRSDKWAGLIGVDKTFNRHWSGSVMYTLGEDRSNLNLVVGYRF